MQQFEDRQNTFASIYEGVLKQGWALAESRGYPSTLEMELNADNVPVEVVESLVEAARDGAEVLQRYHHMRQRLLGLPSYGWSDMFVPLLEDTSSYDYDAIVPLIVDSVMPLGDEYANKMAEQFRYGYVDVFETPGKRSGAYNTGRYGVGSFVLLNYRGTRDDVFTVAHEMGHSMHTRLSQEYQPYATHRYTIFVAEVASILNEKLLLKKFLETVDDTRQRVAFLEAQIEKIKGTYFLQTMMADFEMQAHAMVENGEGITADKLTELWKSVVQTYHGDVIPEDDPYMLSWARIPHLYNSPFYVYQYATCYASAAYLMEQMEADPEATVDRYLTLLKSGGNDYPMNQLRKAGVDLTNREILQAVVQEFDQLVGLLEVEYSKLLDSETVTR
jgi:oligoendopeptidase F